MIMNMVAGGKTPSGTRNITSNGTYDVTDYASVNVNVPNPIDEPVLLWTNANPTSEFAAQTITISLTNYEGVLIEYRPSLSSTIRQIVLIRKNSTLSELAMTSDGDATGLPRARAVTVNASNIVFGAGKNRAATIWETNNKTCVPTRIWGVKFTL